MKPRPASLAHQQQALVQRVLTRRGAVAITDRTGHGLATYVDGYRLRMIECLVDDFPTLRDHLGATAFERLALRVIAADPGDERTLNRWSQRLLRWLEQHPRSAKPADRELAALDWAVVEALRAPLPKAAAPVVPVNPAHLRLVASPTLRLLPSAWTCDLCWLAQRDHKLCPTPQRRDTSAMLAISRTRAHGTEVRVITGDLGHMLQRLASGTKLGVAMRGLHLEPASIGSACQTWIADGLLTWPASA